MKTSGKFIDLSDVMETLLLIYLIPGIFFAGFAGWMFYVWPVSPYGPKLTSWDHFVYAFILVFLVIFTFIFWPIVLWMFRGDFKYFKKEKK